MSSKTIIGIAVAAFLTVCLGLMPVSCANNSSPNSPAIPTPTPTATSTPDPNGPIIVAFYTSVNPYCGAGGFSFIDMVDHSGNPVTTASVTLTTPSGNTTLYYTGPVTVNYPPGSGITNITGGEYQSCVSYLPNQNCSFTVVNGGVTYTSNFDTLNPSSSGVTGSTGVTFTWSNGGNTDIVWVGGNDTAVYGSPLTSPYSIPAGNFPGDPAGAANDTVELDVLQVVPSAFSGGQASCVVATGSALIVRY